MKKRKGQPIMVASSDKMESLILKVEEELLIIVKIVMIMEK
jgi:hypothetical protein